MQIPNTSMSLKTCSDSPASIQTEYKSIERRLVSNSDRFFVIVKAESLEYLYYPDCTGYLSGALMCTIAAM